jgi:hypothetical protein
MTQKYRISEKALLEIDIRMKRINLLFLFMLILISCNSYNYENLPESFNKLEPIQNNIIKNSIEKLYFVSDSDTIIIKTYNQAGKLLEDKVNQFSGSRRCYEFDSLSLLSSKEVFTDFSKKFIVDYELLEKEKIIYQIWTEYLTTNKDTTIFYLNKDGLIIKEEGSTHTSGGEVYYTTYYYYNNDIRLERRDHIFKDENNKFGINRITDEYRYSNGLLKKEISKTYKNDSILKDKHCKLFDIKGIPYEYSIESQIDSFCKTFQIKYECFEKNK